MFKLNCAVQNYAWGKKGAQSLCGRIWQSHNASQVTNEFENTPFSELWLGDHVNGPSKIDIDKEDSNQAEIIGDLNFMQEHHGKSIPVSQLFSGNPDKFYGPSYSEKYPFAKDKLAFLFKVLSVRTALSIQAHPNRSLAEKLHQARPDIYKDPNPKPEIAIALSDDFIACFGFAGAEQLRKTFDENPSLIDAFGLESDKLPDSDFLKQSVETMFNDLDRDHEKLQALVNKLLNHIHTVEKKSAHQELCIRLVDQYGDKDIGVIFCFFFNILTPKRGEWFLIDANIPHAYIQGELMECMINSDNVVRGGLTPKLKDVQTLISMMPYELQDQQAHQGEILYQNETNILTQYLTEQFPELRVYKLQSNEKGAQIKLPSASLLAMCIVINGKAIAKIDNVADYTMEQFSTWYIRPGSEVTFENASEQDEEMLIFMVNPM